MTAGVAFLLVYGWIVVAVGLAWIAGRRDAGENSPSALRAFVGGLFWPVFPVVLLYAALHVLAIKLIARAS